MSQAHRSLDRRRWERVRVRVFERDGYRCTACGKPGRLECDHIVPLQRGGSPYELDNLRTLCRGCHIEITRHSWLTPEQKEWNDFLLKIAKKSL